MKTTVTSHDFIQAFENYGRGEQFSRAGLHALFDYLEELEQDTGEEMELDVIALCVDFAEYDMEELAQEYSHLLKGKPTPEDISEWCTFLQDHTQVIPVDDEHLIVQGF